jgi:peptide/nickel transport system permease protein
MTASTADALTPVGPPDEGIEADRWNEGPGALALLLRRVRGNVPLLVGVGILAAFVLIGIAALAVYGDTVTQLRVDYALGTLLEPPGPSWAHPFGVMQTNGADILNALFQATPIDLALVGGPILIAFAVGALLGAYAGLRRGAVDWFVTGVSDLLVGVPAFFFVIVLYLGVQFFVPIPYRLLVFGLLFAFVLWPYYARAVRTEAVQVARSGYVEAASASGAHQGRVLRRHVLPNSLSPALAQIPVDVFNIFFVLTVFPFLGCLSGGIFNALSPLPDPYLYPEWGALAAYGACAWIPGFSINPWWMYTFPVLVILLFGIGVALASDGVQRHLQESRTGA